MSKIIKEPFAPRRRRPMIGCAGGWSRRWSWLAVAEFFRSQEVSRHLARGCLYRGSFGLLVSDHSALAVYCFMNAVVSHTSGGGKQLCITESDVR